MKEESVPSQSQVKQDDLPPVQPERGKVIKLFISYSHEDTDLLTKLLAHLRGLTRQKVIEVWHDGDIDAGGAWKTDIDKNLDDAHIILLLISASFLDSDYCWQKEMPRALERRDKENVEVIPVILRETDWSDTPIGQLQALPTGGKPIKNWDNKDKAFTNVVKGIRKVVKKVSQRLDKEALEAMLEVAYTNVSFWWRIKRNVSYFALKVKLVFVARMKLTFVIVAFILAALFVMDYMCLFIAESAEGYDNIEDESLVVYLTEGEGPGQRASDAGWRIKALGGFENRLITGNKIGLFKGETTKSTYNIYKNFILEFQARVSTKADRIAWVIRAKDFKNFYLFELTFPKNIQEEAVLRAYVYWNGKRSDKPFAIRTAYLDLKRWSEPTAADRYEAITVKMKVKGSWFYVCIEDYPNAPYSQQLDLPMRDEANTFCYGGVGFLPQSGIDMGLAQLHITPDNSSSKYPCGQH